MRVPGSPVLEQPGSPLLSLLWLAPELLALPTLKTQTLRKSLAWQDQQGLSFARLGPKTIWSSQQAA